MTTRRIKQDYRSSDCFNLAREAYQDQVSALIAAPPEDLAIDKDITGFAPGGNTIFFFPVDRDLEPYLISSKLYFYIASSKDLDLTAIDCFILYINIIRQAFSNMDRELTVAFQSCGINLEVLDQDKTLEWLSAVSLDTITEEDCDSISLEKNESKVLLGIYLNFITKKLSSANIDAWFKKRKVAYCKVSLLKPENETIDNLMPSLNFADCVNACMFGGFPIKRLIFKLVRSISERPTNPLSAVCDITMIYYNMAELTGFSMAYSEVVLKNPILLAWNGLSKHVPKFIAAINLFKSMGPNAPYCKFLYPSKILTPFQHANIGIFISIAHEILILEGNNTFRNCQGVNQSGLPEDLSQKIKEILGLYSGAITKPLEAMRREVLQRPDEITSLLIALNSGTDVVNTGEQELNEPN